MDVSTDTANLALNADAVQEASKAASTPELGDEGGVADVPRSSSAEAAKPSGEATRTKSGDGLPSPTMPVVEELPPAEGEGVTLIAADAMIDDVKEPPLPRVDVEVASQTDEELFKDVKCEADDKPGVNGEPDAPPQTRSFTFSIGRLA
ncbi:hypothetical protein HPB50_003663 [Hyalomma asiaticum]|uniref:Uncharacterized protein n=1 Tax=Hyalomma asiaticum TaxID=266040 RepID=A0ACB7TC37_HYAAI|nr:hypothetical protein HPB50_003663 [Hyalomma asiaticum]